MRRRGGAPQAESLAHGAHVVVGTPGRIQDHLARGSLDLAGLNTLVLDEADRMVDMGFYDDIVAIASHCPTKRQTLLFSATYPDNIRKLAARFLRNPAEVKVEAQHDASRIEQIFYEIKPEERLTPSPACWRTSGQRPRWPSATPRSAATTWSRP